MAWRCWGESRNESTSRAKDRHADSQILRSPWDSSWVRLGTMSTTRGNPSAGTLRHMLAAVAAAVRCVLVSKKSMKVSVAARPLARSRGSGCSTASLDMARSDCSATSMNSIVSSRWQKTGTAPQAATLPDALGRTSRRCVRAREERSISSGLCSMPSSSTRTGRKASTLKPIRTSSWPMLRASHSSVSASICRASLPCSFRAARISFILARPWAFGSRSSRPVPSLRMRFCSAWLLVASLERASSISPGAGCPPPAAPPPPPPPAAAISASQ
mmetsp:Transcript_9406/g.23084  ORF Transcript_9406/g.23084 Transcript_9406/m.23084 type:complete len:273 (-) Transcript_9406:50-868(-)